MIVARDSVNNMTVTQWKMHRFLQTKTVWFWNVSPFVTSNGKIGLSEAGGPFQPGDQICLFPGASVPLAIRKDGDMWVLIGPCFLYGYMDSSKHSEILCAHKAFLQEFALK